MQNQRPDYEKIAKILSAKFNVKITASDIKVDGKNYVITQPDDTLMIKLNNLHKEIPYTPLSQQGWSIQEVAIDKKLIDEMIKRSTEVFKYTQHQSPAIPVKPAPSQQPVNSIQGKSTLQRLRDKVGDQKLTVSIKIVDNKELLQLHFSDAAKADAFHNKFGKVHREETNGNNFSIGVNQEGFVFKNLGISSHGKTKIRPFGDALRFDIKQEEENKARLAPQQPSLRR